jgi:two-component system, chemotaxis family, sensor kinase Cph1
MSWTPSSKVDLSNCDDEPIHIPGSIQPHGVLLVVGEADGRIVQVSANVEAMLGFSMDAVLDQPLERLVGQEQANALRTHLPPGQSSSVEPVRVAVQGRPYDALPSRSDGMLLIDLEPGSADTEAFAWTYHSVRQVVSRLAAATSVPELCRAAAREVRAVTGFDRVMVYRFDADWNGEVVAEDKRDDLNPFLGLHYPASDIPAQARALYARNWIRTITDVDYEPAPLVPQHNSLTNGPLDLSPSGLRSVSPIHIEYLHNMGVAASMSVSLLPHDKLWGLIACHHYSGPYAPPFHVRSAAEFIGQNVSLLLSARSDADARQRALLTAAVAADLVADIGHNEQGMVGVLSDTRLLDLVGATGAAVRLNGETHVFGLTPEPDVVDELATWIWEQSPADRLFRSEALGALNAKFESLKDVASGVLAVSVSGSARQWILWFRPEVVRTVNWGGDPQNKVLSLNEDESVRLSPRKSFELWKQTVRLRCEPWEDHELEAADTLRSHLAGVLLRQAQQDAKVARTLQRSFAAEALPTVPGLAVYGRYLGTGGGRVGGDWYDVVAADEAHVAVALGDVAGHGADAAATMSELRGGLRAYLLDDPTPELVLARLNRLVARLLPDEMATAVVLVLDPRTGRGRAASAGHLPPLIIRGGEPSFVGGLRGGALGIGAGVGYETVGVRLQPGDTVLLYSDGLVERRSEPLDAGLERLRLAARHGPAELDALCDHILSGVQPDGSDDVALLAARRIDPGDVVT